VPRGVPRQVIEMLGAVPLFSACTKEELRAIASLGTEVNVRAGAVLTTQGTPGSQFFLVINGEALCDVDGRTVAKFGAGDFFGEMALLTKAPRSATVTATSDMTLLVLSPAEFASLLDDSPRIALNMLERLADRIRVLESVPTH
jgi:CRP/FNR family transcriptional regulator, cyclic AMP receptor protein